jgi:hypothetical protein
MNNKWHSFLREVLNEVQFLVSQGIFVPREFQFLEDTVVDTVVCKVFPYDAEALIELAQERGYHGPPMAQDDMDLLYADLSLELRQVIKNHIRRASAYGTDFVCFRISRDHISLANERYPRVFEARPRFTHL